MAWNYRVVRSRSRRGEEYLSIRTAWYDSDKDSGDFAGAPQSIGTMEMGPMGETLEEITADLRMMTLALTKPILNEKEFAMKGEYDHG